MQAEVADANLWRFIGIMVFIAGVSMPLFYLIMFIKQKLGGNDAG